MATQETPLFKIHDATVRRKEKVILHVDDFELAEGENIALLGPNGAGKSTFIQLLTREVLPLHRDVPPVIFRGQERPSLADVNAEDDQVVGVLVQGDAAALRGLDLDQPAVWRLAVVLGRGRGEQSDAVPLCRVHLADAPDQVPVQREVAVLVAVVPLQLADDGVQTPDGLGQLFAARRFSHVPTPRIPQAIQWSR